MAARLKPGDTQRLARALEVVRATGRSLAVWREIAAISPLPEAEFSTYTVHRPRAELYARIDARFEVMLEAGALKEVAALEPELRRGAPLRNACGVLELLDHLAGETTIEEAARRARIRTRNYAKRQNTWLRHQTPDARRIVSAEEVLSQEKRNMP
jgi:tRNA dimethylallyltransferase